MKLTCNIEKFKNAVLTADKMTGKNLSLPILHALLIQASGKSLKIRATNLNVGVEIEIPAVIEQEGVVVVKGDILATVCSNLSSSTTISLTLEHDNLTLTSQKTTTIIKSLPPDEFPALPIVEGDTFEIPTTVLQEGIKTVAFAAATTEIKPEIASIFIYSEAEMIYFVATDSFRLAEKKIKLKKIPDISKILIPYKNINDVLRILDVCGESIILSYTRNQLSIRSSTLYFTTRLIDGGFPQYQLIIPKEEATKVVVMKQDLINTLKLSTVFADKFFQVTFAISPQEKQITINSKNSDVGSSLSLVDAVVEGSSLEVVCNLKYFLDVFSSVNGDSVSLSFTTPNKPIMVRSVNDTSFFYLLMPTNR